VFSYLGFEQADQLAGEIKNPQKNLPRAVIIACLIGSLIYILCAVVIIGATPPSLLHHGFQGICMRRGEVSSRRPAPLSLTAGQVTRLPRLARNRRGKRRRGGRHVDQQFGAGIPDRMLGARQYEHHRALVDLVILIAEQHQASAVDDHIHLLLGHVPMAGLLTARQALHPGNTEMLRTELPLG
jgi:hypothetical protein